jgi:hypothetical protein
MGEQTMDPAADYTAEALLADALTREVRALAAVVPVLRHLLGCETPALLSDAILARVRGMIADLSAQLLSIVAGRDPAIRIPDAPERLDPLTERLMADEGLLAHCHALAAEGLIAERLQQRSAIDPVLSPLMQELIAAEDPAVASLAMSTLAAQSRFVQSQRRMELPLGELPAELFHRCLASIPGSAALAQVQAGYDEAKSRIGLLARLVAAMRRGAVAALALDHAGLALFASALAEAARQPRAGVVLACHEGQGMRLALLLRAAGQGGASIERQLGLVGPAAHLPRALADLTPGRAAALLASGDGAGA